MQPSQTFTFVRTYSHWIDSLKRRETWPEAYNRYFDFMERHLGSKIPEEVMSRCRRAVGDMEVMPSMRAMWAAGRAADASNVTLYNCAYLPIADIRAFAETLYVLMCGTGVGYSIENKYVSQLPVVAAPDGQVISLQVPDSKDGWADSLYQALEALWSGCDVDVDYSLIRPAGARLMTMGGRASGPAPLIALIEYCRALFPRAQGRKLRRIECHDILCKIAEIVVVGGVRRSSLISLSDLDDLEMAQAKPDGFWMDHAHRAMANNSAVYDHQPQRDTFEAEWKQLAESGSGERGIFNREALKKRFLQQGRRDTNWDFGVNPCGEVGLRPYGFCNLSEVIIRPEDTLATLKAKVEVATILGMWQSTFTNFPYLRPEWKKNCEEERLLGVSLTGDRDHLVLGCVNNTAREWLWEMRQMALDTAQSWSQILGIRMPAAITLGKPSGTVSNLVNSSSGCHTRWSDFGIRRYRVAGSDPLFMMMRDQGVPYAPEVGQKWEDATTYVVDFPFASPKGAKTRHDVTAIEQLEYWKMLMDEWCEHNQSVTIYVKNDEWDAVREWIWNNWDSVCGISFLPSTDHVYALAPYEEITEAEYLVLNAKFPSLDYSQLSLYEYEDHTEGSHTYACVGGACELS